MEAAPIIYCCVCGTAFPASDPAVLYRSADGKWWCADEIACRAVLNYTIKMMQAALDDVWAELKENGWKIP